MYIPFASASDELTSEDLQQMIDFRVCLCILLSASSELEALTSDDLLMSFRAS
jgi:hypothetical protein